ncbi:serine/threonine-protein kinase [Nocardioides currus]|uniref:non-specific serine/threonine protein kinase n=1 Tax=Nocardioides currus TaxID=2133958 RepID=A0A2R7YYG6_9ACTN|nr:serine/threonine-protein kinase [Nocardioides currus]PUA81391.1 hypothetical protein C7S10_10290 [Nocardioides currus]
MTERIGPYLVDRRLGVGGMGVVYAAHDEALQRPVALKVISPQLADDEEFRTRFVREARAMASLDSPHVVRVYAHGETDGQLWIATQLVPDGDLGTMLRRSGAPAPSQAVDLIAQVASGLADAHAAGLVHRDIKPANVLLKRTASTASGFTAYLADFGIARRAGGDHTGLTQGVVGTPSYMAPELHTGGEAGIASDIYSLGCLLWSTLVGHAPFSGTSDYQVVSAHLEQPVPQLDGDSLEVREINRVLRTAMAKDPGARHRDAAALRDDLRTVQRMVDEAPTAVRAAAAPAPARRSRLPILAAAGVVVLALLGWVVWRVLSPGPEAERVTSPPEVSESTSTSEPTTDPTSDPTSDPPSTPPSTPSSTPSGDVTKEQRATALASFEEALLTQPAVTPESAACVARSVVDEVGLPAMIEQGFFDADFAYVDQDLADKPEMKAALTTAALSCVIP